MAGTFPLTPFYRIAHELSHSLRTIDIYWNGVGNYYLTLMSGYSFDGNDQVSVHLDAWHKFALGWCEPTVRRLDQVGAEFLPEIRTGMAAKPVLLWHPTREAREYFLVERRTSHPADARYDGGFAGNGVLVWRIVQGVGSLATHLGAPDLEAGGSGVWGANQVTPSLLWSDGTPTGFQIAVRPSVENRLGQHTSAGSVACADMPLGRERRRAHGDAAEIAVTEGPQEPYLPAGRRVGVINRAPKPHRPDRQACS